MRATNHDVPSLKICECGHLVTWFVPCDPDTQSDWYDLGYKIAQDVIERDCPHRNGTMIQHCPKCDRKVGMWGCGVAGGMECDCWESNYRPWWRRLLRLTEKG